mgnify:FL=1
MSHDIDHLLEINNPLHLAKYCEEHQNELSNDLFNDSNSILWKSFIEIYFLDKAKYKRKNLSLKDYYIYLYYIHMFNQCNHFKTFMRGQDLLCILPKIYDGDIIAVIHAITNIAITSKQANIVMYRDQKEKNLPIYGNGYLIIQYRNTDSLKKINVDDLDGDIFVSENNDVYIKKTYLELFTVAKYVHPYYGTCNRFLV